MPLFKKSGTDSSTQALLTESATSATPAKPKHLSKLKSAPTPAPVDDWRTILWDEHRLMPITGQKMSRQQERAIRPMSWLDIQQLFETRDVDLATLKHHLSCCLFAHSRHHRRLIELFNPALKKKYSLRKAINAVIDMHLCYQGEDIFYFAYFPELLAFFHTELTANTEAQRQLHHLNSLLLQCVYKRDVVSLAVLLRHGANPAHSPRATLQEHPFSMACVSYLQATTEEDKEKLLAITVELYFFHRGKPLSEDVTYWSEVETVLSSSKFQRALAKRKAHIEEHNVYESPATWETMRRDASVIMPLMSVSTCPKVVSWKRVKEALVFCNDHSDVGVTTLQHNLTQYLYAHYLANAGYVHKCKPMLSKRPSIAEAVAAVLALLRQRQGKDFLEVVGDEAALNFYHTELTVSSDMMSSAGQGNSFLTECIYKRKFVALSILLHYGADPAHSPGASINSHPLTLACNEYMTERNPELKQKLLAIIVELHIFHRQHALSDDITTFSSVRKVLALTSFIQMRKERKIQLLSMEVQAQVKALFADKKPEHIGALFNRLPLVDVLSIAFDSTSYRVLKFGDVDVPRRLLCQMHEQWLPMYLSQLQAPSTASQADSYIEVEAKICDWLQLLFDENDLAGINMLLTFVENHLIKVNKLTLQSLQLMLEGQLHQLSLMPAEASVDKARIFFQVLEHFDLVDRVEAKILACKRANSAVALEYINFVCALDSGEDELPDFESEQSVKPLSGPSSVPASYFRQPYRLARRYSSLSSSSGLGTSETSSVAEDVDAHYEHTATSHI